MYEVFTKLELENTFKDILNFFKSSDEKLKVETNASKRNKRRAS